MSRLGLGQVRNTKPFFSTIISQDGSNWKLVGVIARRLGVRVPLLQLNRQNILGVETKIKTECSQIVDFRLHSLTVNDTALSRR